MKEKRRNTKSIFKKAGPFYIVLAVCICLTATISYFSARHKINSLLNPDTSGKSSAEITTEFTVAVGDIITGIPDERYTETPPASDVEQINEPESDETSAATEYTVQRAANFVMPLEAQMSKAFSNGQMIQSKTMGDWRTHNGSDFAASLGTPVKAVNNGIVKSVYDDVLWGTVVMIDHGDGLLVKYCGLGKGSTVSAGEKIKINDKVGNLGNIPAEAADDVHLHIEMLQDNGYIDPMSILPQQ